MSNNYPVSVIVPVYNCEAFLANSLGNLLNQSLENIEVILVNDGSTDNTIRICHDAESAFGDRVKVIDLPGNRGPGAARNAGLEVALGDYIGFMDADDLIDTSMYGKLYDMALTTGADITDCAFYKAASDTASIHISEECRGALNDDIRSVLIISGGYIWSKLFKRALLYDNDIRFREVYALEDMDFLIRAIISAKSSAGVDEILYHYRDNLGSMSKEQALSEYFDINIGTMEAIYQAVSGPDYPGIQSACEYAMANLYKNAILRVLLDKKPGREKIYIGMLEKARHSRKRCITGDIAQNPFIHGKFDKNDLAVIAAVDASPKRALAMIN